MLQGMAKRGGKCPHISISISLKTGYGTTILHASLVAQMVKNSPKMWETWVQSLGWEDPLEESMATHFRIFAWRIPWTVYPWGC